MPLVNAISLDDVTSSSLIKGVHCGTLAPGVSVLKTLYLENTGAPGDRMMDISVQSRPGPVDEDPDLDIAEEDMTETLQTLVVPTVNSFKVTHDIAFRHSLYKWVELADLRTFDSEHWDDSKGGEAIINFKMMFNGPWSCVVESIRLDKKVWMKYDLMSQASHLCCQKENGSAKVMECALDDSGDDIPGGMNIHSAYAPVHLPSQNTFRGTKLRMCVA